MPPSNASPAYTILYLEDEPALAQLVSRGLQKAGLNVHHVSDGQKAIDFLDQTQPDILLLDLNVPEVSGWNVLKYAREKYGDDAARVIVATANQDAINRLIGRMNFVFRYIVKPYSMDTLLDAIHELMHDEEGAPIPRKSPSSRVILSNDSANLAPQTAFTGPTLEFDFPGLMIGVAEYEEGPTGCTVFHFPRGAATAIDVRGGSVGTVGNYEFNHAICFAGGSLYGLEAASGVAAELYRQRDYDTGFDRIALVSGAVIYDFGQRTNAIYPDKVLGQAAVRTARLGVFPLGARGAGRSATVGKGIDRTQAEPAGQGGAFWQHKQVRLAVFTVVNAIGAVVNREGGIVRGNYSVLSGRRQPLVEEIRQQLQNYQTGPLLANAPAVGNGNTTLTLVVTNLRLSPTDLNQLARQVHASMARAIQPFHTSLDGDALYAVSTNRVDHPQLNALSLGTLASELAWDAVLSAVQGNTGKLRR